MIRISAQKKLENTGIAIFKDWVKRLSNALNVQPGFLALHSDLEQQQSLAKITIEFQSQRLLSNWANSKAHQKLVKELEPHTIGSKTNKSTHYKALITGASSGIGQALAHKCLADKRYSIIVLARRHERLKLLRNQYPGRVDVIKADLTDTENLPNITNRIDTKRLTHVIHNAATENPIGPLCNAEQKELLTQQAVNLNAPILLTNLIKAAGVDECKVIFISSGAAFTAWVGIGPYSISKAAIEMACNAYQAERLHRQEHDMYFASIRPGGVHTEMVERIKTQSCEIFPAVNMLNDKLATGDLLSPTQSADFIYKVMSIEKFSEFERHWNIKDQAQNFTKMPQQASTESS